MGLGTILPVILALLGVLALMLGVIFLMKWLTGKINGNAPTKGMKAVASIGLGQDKYLVAVKAGNRNLLIGTSPSSVNLVCELSDDDMAAITDIRTEADSSEMAGKSFAECLKYNIKKTGGEFFRPYENRSASDSITDDNDDKSND